MFATIPSVINIPLELAAVILMLAFVLGIALHEWICIKTAEKEIKKQKEAREAMDRDDNERMKRIMEGRPAINSAINDLQAERKAKQKEGLRKWLPSSSCFWCNK